MEWGPIIALAMQVGFLLLKKWLDPKSEEKRAKNQILREEDAFDLALLDRNSDRVSAMLDARIRALDLAGG